MVFLSISLSTFAEVKGDPNHKARLEFIYTDYKHMVKIDGADLEPSDGMKAVMEVNHGKHLFQLFVMKGMFKADNVNEERIHLPGGYITRISIKEKVFDVFETVPVPGLVLSTEPPQATPGESSLSTTTSTTMIHTKSSSRVDDNGASIKINGGDSNMSFSMKMPGMNSEGKVTEESSITTTFTETITSSQSRIEPIEPIKAVSRPSKLTFMSDEGSCEIYLDGERKLELGFGGIDEMTKATIYDVSPGDYLLKIEGFDVWYEGKLHVKSGEEIKFVIEPNKFKIIGRTPLP